MKLHIILHAPQIAPNTGNIGRLCAYGDIRLHLVHPLGFEITDKQLRRAGMDYWHDLDVHEHEDWPSFLASGKGPSPERIWALTTQGEQGLWQTRFEPGDGLLFGNEGHGLPAILHDAHSGRRLKVPCFGEGLRSLNLATCAGIVAYEALRQIHSNDRAQTP